MKRAVLHADGASLGNPGPAGIGVVIRADGESIEISEHIGVATNNVAEYSALLRGLEEMKRLRAEDISVYLDSELIVKHIKGQYRVKNEGLKPLYQKALGLIRSFRKFSITHVPREKNARADRLSKQGAKHTEPPAPTAAGGQRRLF